jgi:hypothetical protein
MAQEQITYKTELALLSLEIADGDQYGSLAQLLQPEKVQNLLAQQALDEPTMDIRTQAAYLMNGLSWQLCSVLAWLDLRGMAFDDVSAGKLRVNEWLEQGEHEGKPYHYVRYQWHLPELIKAAESTTAATVGEVVVALQQPIVQAVNEQSGLSKGALWRLVGDSLSYAYLYLGQQLGQAEYAMQRAQTLIELIGKPLANRQWRFQYYEATSKESSSQTVGEWYRLRGGCCRYYTLPEGEYCSTCVHLSDEQRQQRITAELSNSL